MKRRFLQLIAHRTAAAMDSRSGMVVGFRCKGVADAALQAARYRRSHPDDLAGFTVTDALSGDLIARIQIESDQIMRVRKV